MWKDFLQKLNGYMRNNNIIEKFNELLLELEEDTSEFHYFHHKTDALRQFYKSLEEKGQINTEIAKQIRWECMLFDLVLKPKKMQWEGEEGKVFFPMFVFSNGSVYPDVNKFTEETYEYFKKRVNETKNPIHKVRYCEAIWELSSDKEKYKYAKEAVDTYLECADIFLKNLSLKENRGIELSHILQRATELALTKGIGDEDKINKIKLKIFYIMNNLSDNKDYRWCLELTRTLSEYKDKLTKEEIDRIIEINRQAVNFYKNENDYHFQRAFLLNLIEIYKLINDGEQITKTRLEIAESYKLEGDYVREHRKPGNLVAAHFYEQSVLKYKELGKKDISDELISKVKECYKLAEAEFIKIKTLVELPMDKVDKYVNELLNLTPKEILRRISIDNNLLPNIAKASLQSEKDKILFPLSNLLPESVIHDTKKVYNSVRNDEPLEHNVRKNILFQIQFIKIILTKIFEKLKEKSIFTEEILTEFLSEADLIDKEDLEIIKIGIGHYFKGEYLSALHILVPRLEGVLRKMLANIIQITKIGQKRMQDMTLNELLKKEEVWQNLGDNFVIYLYLVLVSQQGLNLRNDIAHGFVNKDMCTKEIANIILHMLIISTSFEIKRIEI